MNLFLYTFVLLGSMFWTAIFAYNVGYNRATPEPVAVEQTFPTGYEVFESANVYRRNQGLAPLILEKGLCNNIGARAINYEKTNSHNGLHEFAAEWMPDYQVMEILAWGTSGDHVVTQWAGSPSHDLLLKEATRGCAYSNRGWSVMLLSR